jgi:hypothetical protein
MLVEFPAHADQTRVAAEHAAQQPALDLLADRLHEGPGFLPDFMLSGAGLAWRCWGQGGNDE